MQSHICHAVFLSNQKSYNICSYTKRRNE